MTASLLDFPPELLTTIFSFLPVNALLKFSETSRYAHFLATSSLHTLALGIHPSRTSSIISRLATTAYPRPRSVESSFSPAPCFCSTAVAFRNNAGYGDRLDSLVEEPLVEDDPYRVSMLIPDAQTFGYATLLSFHTALTKSVLTRHGGTLRNLDLSLWTLTTPVAKVIARMSALRALSIRIEDFPHIRAVPRDRVASQHLEQSEAWDILTGAAVWPSRLVALRIEGAGLTTSHITRLLHKSRWCRELWLCKSPLIGADLFSFLGSEEWEGRAALRILGIMRCGGQLSEEVLHLISRLHTLQFLSLQGCYGVDSETIESWNKDVWKIPECIPPLPRMIVGDADMVIEVDPLYMQEDEMEV